MDSVVGTAAAVDEGLARSAALRLAAPELGRQTALVAPVRGLRCSTAIGL